MAPLSISSPPSMRSFSAGLGTASSMPWILSGAGEASASADGPWSGTKAVSGALAGKRVLLVEDEAMVALDLELALGDAGAEVAGPIDRLADGFGLLDRDAAVDVAILDIDLHGEDVFPLAERLEDRGIPFLFHTGHGDRNELHRRFDAAPVCMKPVRAEDMVKAVADLLG